MKNFIKPGNAFVRQKNTSGKGRPAPMTVPVGLKGKRRTYGKGGKLK